MMKGIKCDRVEIIFFPPASRPYRSLSEELWNYNECWKSHSTEDTPLIWAQIKKIGKIDCTTLLYHPSIFCRFSL